MRPLHRSQVSPRTIWTVGLHALGVLAVGLAVRRLGTVLEWMAVALLLALALDPAVRAMVRGGVRRGVAVLVAVGGVVALLLGTAGSLVPMLVEQVESLAQALPDLLVRLRDQEWFRWADARFGLLARARAALQRHAYEVAAPVVDILTTTLTLLAAALTVLVLSIFALLFGGELYQSALRWVHPSHRPRVRALVRRMRRAVGGYVAGTLLVAAIGGGVTAVVLLLLGVPYFLPLGLAMMVLGIIPFLGSALGALMLTSTALLTVGWQRAVVVLGVFLVYQQVEGNLLQPLVQRHTIRMNPLLIAVVMLLGTALGGLLGTLLALPVAGAVQVLLEDVRRRRHESWGERVRPGPLWRERGGRGLGLGEGALWVGPVRPAPRRSAPDTHAHGSRPEPDHPPH